MKRCTSIESYRLTTKEGLLIGDKEVEIRKIDHPPSPLLFEIRAYAYYISIIAKRM